MLTLDTLNIMLAVSEEAMIEEMIVALLASPKMVVFLKNFLALKAITDDIPRWRESLRSRLKDTHVPPELAEEVICYQQSQLLSHAQFIVQLPQILSLLHRLHSPGLGKRSNWSMTTAPLRPPCIRFFSSAGA